MGAKAIGMLPLLIPGKNKISLIPYIRHKLTNSVVWVVGSASWNEPVYKVYQLSPEGFADVSWGKGRSPRHVTGHTLA